MRRIHSEPRQRTAAGEGSLMADGVVADLGLWHHRLGLPASGDYA